MINTNNWGKFRIGDLFDIHPTKAYKLTNALLLDDGKNPVVVNSSYNNGIGGCSTLKTTEKGNMVTFSDTVDANTIFYQPYDFIGYPHVQGLYPLKYEDKWNEYTYSFFISAFRGAAIAKGFDYGNKFRRDIAIDLIIKLPIASDGQPNWKYMESYMKKIMAKSEQNINELKKIDDTKNLIDISKWKKFHLYDKGMFEIDMGNKMDRVKMSEINPSVLFVGRANANNGITAYVDKVKDVEPYPSGYMTLSLGGEYLGSCFIQPKPFYTSQNVIVLKPSHNMTENIKLFIATMIFRESRSKYKAFVDELNRHIKRDFSIYLPATLNGEPDWKFMENYMSKIIDKAKQKINKLKEIS